MCSALHEPRFAVIGVSGFHSKRNNSVCRVGFREDCGRILLKLPLHFEVSGSCFPEKILLYNSEGRVA